MKKYLIKIFIVLVVILAAVYAHDKFWKTDKIQVVKVESTVENDNAKLKIVFPKRNEQERYLPIKLQFRVEGFPLKINSDFERKDALYNYDYGQSIHVMVDNKPYFPVVQQRVDPNNDEADYYQAFYEATLDGPLSSGPHVIRAFLARSYGESLKNDQTFDSIVFYYKTKKKTLSLNKPYLTFNEPSTKVVYQSHKPILLDFIIKNTELSTDGYKVKLSIDHKNVRYLSEEAPYFIYGLAKGSHLIDLQLVDGKGRPVSGSFNSVKKVIKVE